MNKSNFYLIIIGALAIILLLQKCGNGGGCNPPSQPSQDTVRTVDTVYTTITDTIHTYVPKWKTKIKYVHDTTRVIDTVEVIGDYFSTYIYQDSIITDTLKLHIRDSVTQNKIKARDINYSLTFPTITINNNIIQRKNEYYYGLSLTGKMSGIMCFGPELLLRTKRRDVYGLGVVFDKDLKTNISLRTYWTIGKN